MTPERATLMTLVQCRPMWFWHFWGLVICLTVLVTANTREGAVFSLLVVPLWTGAISTSLYKDFLTKPFSFGAPEHMRVWRRALFSIAIAVAGVCALATLLTPAGTPGVVAVTAWQAFVLCLAMFMVAVLVVTATGNASFLPALITGFVIIIFNHDLAESVRVSVDDALLANPLATTVTCAVILFAAWRQLGSRRIARRMCGETFLGLQSTFSGERTAAFQAEIKMRRMRRPPGALMKSLEGFFIARMQALSGHSTLGSLWGSLYVQIGRSAPATAYSSVAPALFLVAVSLVLGYYHPHRLGPISGANLILFLVITINAEYRINPYAGLMLNVSRKNRFRSLMFSALTQWLVVAVFAAVLTVLSIVADRFLDDLTVYGRTYTYTPIHPKAFFAFAPMLPFYFLSQVLCPRRHVIALMVVATVGVIAFFAGGHRILEMPVFGIVLFQVASWLPFVAFVRQYCYSWDLKLNGQ